MANFINKYSDLAAYNADETKEYPNVSYLETEDEVKWQATEPIDQEHVVAKFNVTSTAAATRIYFDDYYSNVSYMIVDGVQISPSTGYTFSTTGEHKVKYKINSNWNGDSAFRRCYNLTEVTTPDSVTTIGNNAFYECSGLTSVIIGSGVTSIGDSAFNRCSALTSITIPDSVTSIGNNAFQYCFNLTSINIPSGVASIGNYTFQECRSLTSVTIPDSVTSVGKQAFQDCSGLTSATIGSGVTSIGDSAFYQCTGLTNIIILNNIISIGVSAFNRCSGLTSVIIGSGVTSIGGAAFFKCTSLTSITVNATTPPTLSNTNALSDTNNCPIYVPAESVNAYKTASGWSTYASRIQAIQ